MNYNKFLKKITQGGVELMAISNVFITSCSKTAKEKEEEENIDDIKSLISDYINVAEKYIVELKKATPNNTNIDNYSFQNSKDKYIKIIIEVIDVLKKLQSDLKDITKRQDFVPKWNNVGNIVRNKMGQAGAEKNFLNNFTPTPALLDSANKVDEVAKKITDKIENINRLNS